MSGLALNELLSGLWLEKLSKVIESQRDAEKFLGKARGKEYIPKRENTFAALKGRDPQDWKVVIIGQDPYPREESAVGIAFNDGAIKKWTDKLNPSFTNIMKSVLIHEKKTSEGGDIAAFRAAAKASNLIDPPAWFDHSQKEGVMWINTALTFSSKEIEILKQHTDFWRPIVTSIFEIIIEAKKTAMNNDKARKDGLVFIMWGGYAQKLRTAIEAINKKTKPELPLIFVENNHPAATGTALTAFHQNNSFTQANAGLVKLGLTPVNWFAAKSGAEAEDASSSLDNSKKRKGGKEADTSKAKKGKTKSE